LEIGRRYEIHFIEIGMEADHVHFMVQSVPTYPVNKIVRIIKSITAREIFKRHKGIKKELWGAALWTSGYYANTVGQFASSEVIKKYVANQGREYRKLYSAQLKFDF
jgi:REP element-mobilizing transposase RayT